MGGDSFLAFYGIKFALSPQDEAELDACGSRTDPRCIAARRVGLDSFSGRLTNGEDYFLYLGKRIAMLGLENDTHSAQSADHLSTLAEQVSAQLKAAGFTQPAEFHFQLIAEY